MNAVNPQLIRPATFFQEKDRKLIVACMMLKINGTYILLKLWSSRNGTVL
jgi:hypothetical protein